MDCLYRSLLIYSVVIITLLNRTNGYTITVDAHAEECFYENVEADTKMGKLVFCINIISTYSNA